MEFREQALHYCDTISALTGVSCKLLDADSDLEGKETICPGCGKTAECNAEIHVTACEEALRWNGHYRYHCPCGHSFLATTLRRPRLQNSLTMITGPFYVSEENPKNMTQDVPVLSEKRIRALDDVIRAVCGYIAGGRMMSAVDSNIQAEMLQTMYLSTQSEVHISYPLDNERQLQQLIRLGNKKDARKLLNEMLLELYSGVGTDLLMLKLRIRELITLMSRAAADGGANVNTIFAFCDSAAMELERKQDFDELDAWLGVIMHKFFDMVFDFNDAKHQSVIQQASSFIQEHLSEKITLEQVAAQVYLSKSYLCRILKEELGCTFTEYTNRLRIERSKLYLHRSAMSLAEIACAVGFDDQSYFTRIFKRQVGVPPGKYRTNNSNSIYTS